MSARAVMWAREQRLPCPQKVVLLILATHLNPKDGRCFPSQETLAWETGLSRRAVQLALKALAKSKHIEVTKRRQSGKWAGCVYRLALAEKAKPKPRNHAHEVRTDHSKKTEHGDHAHEVRTKGDIYLGEAKPELRLVKGGAQ